MSEQEPSQEREPKFTFEVDGYVIEVYPSNSAAYLHLLVIQRFDHVYVRDAVDGKPVFAFRAKIENFDDVIEYMENFGYDVIPQDEPSALDLRVYYDTAEGLAELQALIDEAEAKPYDTKIVAYLEYLLDNDLINFEIAGDIML